MNKSNKLINEQSPYLIQHAYNPVDWMPWGEQAFEKAKQENKPVFLSIGYSTCHWCHVMAHETFEDIKIAEILNKDFISVKVDKEERPDVDNIYMEVCQLYTGSGGWPLSIFLDHNMRPFFAGTYFPKASFKNILHRIIDLWNSDREKLVIQAKQITDFIKREKETSYSPLQNTVNGALRLLKSRFEPDYGGFSHPPKFPTPHNLLFLLEYHKVTGDKESLFMCEKTLKALRCGGIYDHIGGGFSRYSTDKMWLVPHFEKMLYDNALLIIAYSKCYEITKNIFYSDTVKEIITYLMRDMKDSNGAFYTAEDADSEGHEGLFYTFTIKEINAVLKEDAAEFCLYYDITSKGNFEGRNILNTINKEIVPDKKEFTTNCLKKLFNYRETRKRPHRDEKILLSNNGLMIAALSTAGRALKAYDIYGETYINAAKKIVKFIDENLTDKSGKLISFYLNKPGKHQGFAEDYAFLIWGLLELYKAVQDKAYLNKAIELQDIFNKDFFDEINGGFYISGKNAERLITRTKELYDGAVPSYNSVTLNNLLELYLLTQNIKYLEQLVKTLKYFSADLAGMPFAYVHSVQALLKLQDKLPEIKICYNSACRPPAKNIDEFIKIFD